MLIKYKFFFINFIYFIFSHLLKNILFFIIFPIIFILNGLKFIKYEEIY